MIEKLLLIFLVTFFSSLWLVGYVIKKSKRKKHLCVRDMYKEKQPLIPSTGGIAIIAGLLVSLTITQLFVNEVDLGKLLIFYFIVLVYGVFGLLDDLVDLGRIMKIFAPYFMALPIALINTDTTLSLIFVTLNIGLWFSYLIAPIYIMVVANLVNMHSGYNGLAGGVSTIILFFIGLKSVIEGNISNFFYLIPILGALLAFMYYNKYPSQIFLGNAGSLLIGSAIGAALILFNMEIFGIIILIPHIVNFLMWCVWVVLMKMHPNKHPHIKFAEVRKDGTVNPPNVLTIKYALCKIFRLKESSAVWILYGLTVVFGIIGLVVV